MKIIPHLLCLVARSACGSTMQPGAKEQAMTFKQRVHSEIIKGAAIYQKVFAGYEYLIYSENFKNKPYYIISAAEDNYPHLTGVNSLLSAQAFFDKCLDGSLSESDFDFSSKNRSEKEVIGSVRRKIQILPLLDTIFQMKLQAEEGFVKGKVSCSLATADNAITIGFADTTLLRPKTLLKSNELNPNKAVDITLILRRNRGLENFDTVIQGNAEEFSKAFPGMFMDGTSHKQNTEHGEQNNTLTE